MSGSSGQRIDLSDEPKAGAPSRPAIGRGSITPWFVGLALAWTAVVLFSLLHDSRTIRSMETELARAEAVASFDWVDLYRRWATAHGGVYVPVTETTQPNPYLAHVPERDITTPSGRRLTLMNAAYMTHQIHQLTKDLKQKRGHFTSLNPLRPQNRPDTWERNALEEIGRGEKSEVNSVELMGGQPYLRLMKPLVTENSCLLCHAVQGYKVGDIRGGLSVAVPMAPYESIGRSYVASELLFDGTTWALGMIGLTIGGWRLQGRRRDLDRAVAALEASELKFRTIADFTYDWEYWRGQDGRMIYVSPSCQRVTGYPAEDFSADPALVTAIVHPEDRAAAGGPEESTAGKPHLADFRIVTRAGKVRWIEHNCRPVFDDQGRWLGRRGSNRDITDRRLLESERENLLAQVEAKNEELERFTYTVAHDLKSPLLTIAGFLGPLEQAADQGELDQVRTHIGRINGAADRMRQLLDSLLELARVGRLADQRQRVSMTVLANEAVQNNAGRIAQRHVQVEVAPDMPEVCVDRPRLLQVLENLVGNAVKFMGDQPAGHLTIGTRQDDGETVYYVRDNGVGIDPARAKDVFEIFRKLDPRAEGTGLGLAIVRRIIAAHGGRVWVESEGLGKGSTFCFTLPEKPDDPAQAEAP